MITQLETNINDKLNPEITNLLKEKFKDNTKLFSKTLHNISTLHDKDFYKNSLKSNKKKIYFLATNQDKKIQNFEIDDINYEDFNLKEFKKMYNSNGIHVYDVNLQGNYGNGNSKGVLTYKIRKNEDIVGFNDKLSEINSKIGADFKIGVKAKNNTNKRPM